MSSEAVASVASVPGEVESVAVRLRSDGEVLIGGVPGLSAPVPEVDSQLIGPIELGGQPPQVVEAPPELLVQRAESPFIGLPILQEALSAGDVLAGLDHRPTFSIAHVAVGGGGRSKALQYPVYAAGGAIAQVAAVTGLPTRTGSAVRDGIGQLSDGRRAVVDAACC